MYKFIKLARSLNITELHFSMKHIVMFYSYKLNQMSYDHPIKEF